MKNLILIITLFLFLPQSYPQNFWEIVNDNFKADLIEVTQQGNLIASNSTGLFRSFDGGVSWEQISFNNPVDVMLTINDSIIVIGNYNNVFVSYDFGDSWQTTGAFYVKSLAYDSLSEKIYLGTMNWYDSCKVFSSTDFGQTWHLFKNFPEGPQYAMVGSIIISAINGVMLVGITRGDTHWGSSTVIFKSTDMGLTWEPILQPFEHVYDMIENFNGNFYITIGVETMISLDAGISWISKNIDCSRLCSDYLGNIYYMKYNSIYCTDENGDGLTLVGEILSCCVYDIVVSLNNQIYVAHSNGIYRGNANNIILSTYEDNTLPLVYVLSQNYPNPFNPITNIKFEIPDQAWNENLHVTLKVYDILGNDIVKLVNEQKPAGNYEVEFDASGLTSGIYYYQLRAGDFVETKKMVLLK